LFERYTESARRTLFFARYETTQLGQTSIEPEHLLLGLLRDALGVARLLREAGMRLDEVRGELESRIASPAVVPTSVEIPFARSTVRVLQLAEEEANALRHREINNGHLLAGLLREESSIAAELLRAHDVRLKTVRERIEELPPDAEELVLPTGEELVTLDIAALVAHVERIQKLLQQLTMAAPDTARIPEIALLINEELEALKARFEP
jgi:ATP-dependent Clp protease ATP-binding subunit ClpA